MPSEVIIEISSKTTRGSATVTARLPKQSIALIRLVSSAAVFWDVTQRNVYVTSQKSAVEETMTRSASVPFKKQKTKPL